MGFDLGSLIGGGLGFLVGGPMGAAAGAGLGKAAEGGSGTDVLQSAAMGGLGGYLGAEILGPAGLIGAGGAAGAGATTDTGLMASLGGFPSAAPTAAGDLGGLSADAYATYAASGGQPTMMDVLRQRFGQLGFGGGAGAAGGAGGAGIPSWLRTGIGGLQLAGGLQQYQAQAERQAQQQNYARQMQALVANPSSVESLPGYQAGLRAVQRKGRAEGFGGSGSMAAALAGYGGQQYQQQLANLAALQGGSQPVGSPMMGLVGAGTGLYNLFGGPFGG